MTPRDLLPWNHGPPVLARLGRNYLLASCVAVLIAMALAFLREPLGLKGPRAPLARWGPLFFGAIPLCVLLPRWMWHWRRMRRNFAQARGRLCTHCAYVVGPLGERGTCPECGHVFDAKADAATWLRAGYKFVEPSQQLDHDSPVSQ